MELSLSSNVPSHVWVLLRLWRVACDAKWTISSLLSGQSLTRQSQLVRGLQVRLIMSRVYLILGDSPTVIFILSLDLFLFCLIWSLDCMILTASHHVSIIRQFPIVLVSLDSLISSVSPYTVLSYLRWSDLMKRLLQTGQMKFFSPVCVRMCLANSSDRANFLIHPAQVQGKGRSPEIDQISQVFHLVMTCYYRQAEFTVSESWQSLIGQCACLMKVHLIQSVCSETSFPDPFVSSIPSTLGTKQKSHILTKFPMG